MTQTAVKETGIIMSGSHPLDILEGRKTMTRRTWGLEKINQNPKKWRYLGSNGQCHIFECDKLRIELKCPYGGPGDRLRIKETWAAIKLHDNLAPRDIPRTSPIWYRQKEEARIGLREINPWPEGNIGKWRPSMFMPRWASRIVREITEVRAERVQDIDYWDAGEEGLGDVLPEWMRLAEFHKLWDSLNATRGHGWEKNDWVWPIAFRRLDNAPI